MAISSSKCMQNQASPSQIELTRMRIRNRHLPYRNMRKNRCQKFAQRQRHNKSQIIRPRHIGEFPDAPQIEKRSTVDRNTGQLDHCHGHRKRKLIEQHFANHIIAGRNNVPQQAQNADAERFAAASRTAQLIRHGEDDSESAFGRKKHRLNGDNWRQTKRN